MGRKRKRPSEPSQPAKLRKLSTPHVAGDLKKTTDVNHAVLSAYYPRVLTLRSFLMSRLPQTSRLRRRKILSFSDLSSGKIHSLIDTTLVGVLKVPNPAVEDARKRDYMAFTQTQQRLTHTSNGSGPASDIGEVVDFVIWLLFHKSIGNSARPQHILCHGFQKCITIREKDDVRENASGIPGVIQQHPNENFEALKNSPWKEIMQLLGGNGESIIQSLLLDCGTFVQLSSGVDNFYQISGIPIADLSPMEVGADTEAVPSIPGDDSSRASTSQLRKPGDIAFVRSRILYAKPSLNAKGEVRFGMKHIQVLNRFSNPKSITDTVHIMKYIFPRQFGLHNVFSREVDKKEISQPFKDYTLRETEIGEKRLKTDARAECRPPKIPKRLRGAAFSLVKRLQKRHRACPYTQLLRYYCLAKPEFLTTDELKETSQQFPKISGQSKAFVTQISMKSSARSLLRSSPDRVSTTHSSSIMDYATPVARISAFCQAIIRHLLPSDALGVGADGAKNMSILLGSANAFIRKRRFESLTLHQVGNNIKLNCIDWLRQPHIDSDAHLSWSDRNKRLEILNEFLYYVFDSLLIPLIRTNFYVTESGVHGKRLFYFRHDVWRKISEPSLAHLRLSMFESLPPQASRKILNSRALGVGQVRLLPKLQGIRTIVNLKRQTVKTFNGGKSFVTSVNKQLAGVFSVLKYERLQQPFQLGSALFSIGEMRDRLRSFKNTLTDISSKKLYFVKVDIRSCFDTIPQNQLVAMVEKLVSEEQYRIAKHCELKPIQDRSAGLNDKPARTFMQRAVPVSDCVTISEQSASALASGKRLVVFADTGRQQIHQSKALLKLLQEHVKNNVVKLGKKHFRQRNGIPQGSVLSSLLCSFFYGQFEREHLSFLDTKSSLLLRLIDDFLLITTEEHIARRFLEVMAEGMPSYGISVNSSKSLTNFEAAINNSKIPRHHGTTSFPYCGMSIDTRTIEVSKDREKKDLQIANTLTIEASRNPGRTFRRRVQTFLKIQMHAMLLDTSHNTTFRVMSSLFENFTETAIKLHQYSTGLAATKRPAQPLIIRVIEEVISLAYNLTRSKSKASTQSENKISRAQVCWIAVTAFEQVLRRKQSSYRYVLTWLVALGRSCEAATKLDFGTLGRIAESGKAFKEYVF